MRTNPKLEACSTYLAIFCLAEVFEVYITLEALLQSNILQIGLSESSFHLTVSQVSALRVGPDHPVPRTPPLPPSQRTH